MITYKLVIWNYGYLKVGYGNQVLKVIADAICTPLDLLDLRGCLRNVNNCGYNW